jgi:hypothetical protein
MHQGVVDGCHWLLIRRCIDDPHEKAYYLVFAPPATTLLEMVWAIGARWHIEEDLEATKDLVGESFLFLSPRAFTFSRCQYLYTIQRLAWTYTLHLVGTLLQLCEPELQQCPSATTIPSFLCSYRSRTGCAW